MAVTFIGDVHGWSERLERVLAQAEGRPIFMGDLMDRGPDSQGVVKRVRALCDSGKADCLLGNHEWIVCRALGAAGGPADPLLFERWIESWGGDTVLRSYGVSDAAGLRIAMGDDLEWMVNRPWVLEGGGSEAGSRRWCAVHAGLEEDLPYLAQIARLARGWLEVYPESDPRPPSLFSKRLIACLPPGLPLGTCIISGHTPMPQAIVAPDRILCDTSGGQPGRKLSGVIWPVGKIING